MRVVHHRRELAWLEAGWTGVQATGFAATTWLLHAMHEGTGTGRRRLRWRELARREGTDPFADGPPPNHRAFRGCREAGIAGPAEGALDADQQARVVDRLAEVAVAGLNTPCFVYYATCWDVWTDHLFAGPLREARAIDGPSLMLRDTVTPTAIWPADRSWLVASDADLCGTSVSGDERAVALVEADPELETVRLPGRR